MPLLKRKAELHFLEVTEINQSLSFSRLEHPSGYSGTYSIPCRLDLNDSKNRPPRPRQRINSAADNQ
jgi:hypothetical protein